jgi:hypothetical protein
LAHHPPGREQAGDGGRGGYGQIGLLGVLATQPPEGVAEGEIGQGAGVQVEAVPDEDESSVLLGLEGEFTKEPGLADAGLASQQSGMRAKTAGFGIEQCAEPGKVFVAADEGGRGQHHVVNHGRPH